MHIVSTAFVHAAEEVAEHGSQVSPFVFGAFAFLALCALLVITLMVKVGD